jgi:hypothetical protein
MGHNEYGKPALAYLGLKDLLGDELFRKSLHGFMDRWNSKHPLPWDMFNSFSNVSGKDLSWYFNNWFFTNNYMDIAVDKLVDNAKGYTLTVKNIGGFVIPFDAMIEYADGTTDTLHYTPIVWEKDQQLATITIATKKKITYLKLDGGIYMDADEKNNTWGTAKGKVAAASVDVSKYIGVYASPQVPLKITITNENGGLFAEATGQEKIPLENTEKDTFSFAAAGLTLVFNTEKSEMTLKQGGGAYVFTKEK